MTNARRISAKICAQLVRLNVRQEAVANGRTVLCVFKFSQVV